MVTAVDTTPLLFNCIHNSGKAGLCGATTESTELIGLNRIVSDQSDTRTACIFYAVRHIFPENFAPVNLSIL